MSTTTLGSGIRASLPHDWKLVELGNLCDHKLGKMLDRQKNEGVSRPYLRNPNVKWFEFDLTDVKKMPIKDSEREKYSVRPGDVIVCEGGEAGRAAIWDGEAEEMYIQKALHRVRVGAELHNRYLVYVLMADAKSGHLNSYFTGTTIPHFTGQDLHRYEIPLPPLSEQKRIADILDKADAIRRKRQKAIQHSENILRSAYLHLFGDPVVNPQGWAVEELGTIADMVTGFAFKSSEYVNEGIRLCRGANVLPDRIDWSDVRYWRSNDSSIDAKLKLNIGDVVLAMDRPWISSGIKVAQLKESDLPAYLVQRVTRLRGEGCISNAFLYFTIRHPAFTAYCGGLKTETTVPHISSSDIKSFRVPVAPRHVHETFETLANKIKAGFQRLHRAADEANSLFNSLIQSAFKGEL